jgi:hypothetical protein
MSSSDGSSSGIPSKNSIGNDGSTLEVDRVVDDEEVLDCKVVEVACPAGLVDIVVAAGDCAPVSEQAANNKRAPTATNTKRICMCRYTTDVRRVPRTSQPRSVIERNRSYLTPLSNGT